MEEEQPGVFKLNDALGIGHNTNIGEVEDYTPYQAGSISFAPLNQWFIQRQNIQIWLLKHRRLTSRLLTAFFLLGFIVFLGFSIAHDVDGAIAPIVFASIIVVFSLYVYIRDNYNNFFSKNIFNPVHNGCIKVWPSLKWITLPVLSIGIALYLTYAIVESMEQLQSVLGLIFFIAIAWLFSKHPDDIKFRPVVCGIGLQLLGGVLVLRWKVGYDAVNFISDETVKFMEYSFAGASEMFGNPWFLFHPYPMMILPLTVYLAAWTSIMTQLGLTQLFLRKLGWVMQATMSTTAVESVSLVANFFLSVLDSMLLMKYYLVTLTDSELFTYAVGSHASIAGFAFMIFIWFGATPHHLLVGSMMSAPAAVAISKLHYPETEQSVYTNIDKLPDMPKIHRTLWDAAMNGAYDAGKAVLNLLVQLIAFISIIEFIDAVIGWLANKVDVTLSIRIIFGKIFKPLAWLMGVHWSECEDVGTLIGLKIFTSELLGFIDLGELSNKNVLSPRANAIATYALCGFSSFGTLYMFAGVWKTLVPSKAKLAINLIPRILLCCNLACFMTASVAGLFYDDDKLDTIDQSSSSGLALFVVNGLPGINELMNLM